MGVFGGGCGCVGGWVRACVRAWVRTRARASGTHRGCLLTGEEDAAEGEPHVAGRAGEGRREGAAEDAAEDVGPIRELVLWTRNLQPVSEDAAEATGDAAPSDRQQAARLQPTLL